MNRFLLTLMLLAAAGICRAEMVQKLVLHANDGTEIEYLLDNEPVVTFDAGQAKITDATASASFPLDDIAYWDFRTDKNDAVESVATESARIVITGNTATVTNPGMLPVAVYAINGTLVGSQRAETCSFELSAGIYIVAIGSTTHKILIR